MKVVLLAAGRSLRMEPIKDKNFLDFFGKPLIEHQVETLHKAGFADFLIVGGEHNLEKLEEWAFKSPYSIKCVEQKVLEDGMKGAVLAVRDYISDNEPILIVSSNDICSVEAFELVNENSQNAEDIDGFMVAKRVSEYFPGGYVAFSKDNMLEKIVEKPGAGNEPSDLVNLVIHLWKNPSELFVFLEKHENSEDDAYEAAIDEMVKNNRKIKILEYEGVWQPIKYPWHILEVWKLLMPQPRISKKAEIAASATVKGSVIIEEGVKIMENAVINGPCYIGPGTVVANNALVRDSYVSANCVIGFSTEIARSYLGSDVWTHSNYIGDSIIGRNTSFGSGCVTGNLRLDDNNIHVHVKGDRIDTGSKKFGLITGENVRVGINTSFMPGTKIGNDSFIGAGITVSQIIEDGKFVHGKWDLIIKDNLTKADIEERSAMKKKL